MSQTSSEALEECERLFVELLEQVQDHGLTPDAFFAKHPDHAATLQRWWQLLGDTGEVGRFGPDNRFGPFVLLRALGAGAQGFVHLADDSRTNRRVALKILPTHRALRAGAVSRFEREASVTARLKHPGICEVFSSGEHDGAAYIAMRYVEGQTVSALLAAARAESKPFELQRALMWVEQLSHALHAAHTEGLIHRDVKPGNVMIDGADQPVLLDFGLAHDRDDDSDLTRTGDVIGTPAYMSPEQLQGVHVEVDARADVYSLGVILFELLTLRRPFEAATQELLHRQILAAPFPDIRSLRSELTDDVAIVLQTAMARDRMHRYETADQFARDLHRLRTGQPVLARPPTALQRCAAWCRRSPALATSLGLLFVSLAAGAIIGFTLYIEAQSARTRYDQLADVERLRDARASAATVEDGSQDDGAAIARWLSEHGEPLASTLPRHQHALGQLAQQAITTEAGSALPERVQQRIRDLTGQLEHSQQSLIRPRNQINRELHTMAVTKLTAAITALQATPMPPERRFANSEDAFLHRSLSDLVTELEQFTSPRGMLPTMRQRAAWAQRVRAETITSKQDLWQRVQRELAEDERFAGRELQPQLGLVPLGRDPRSGLQEFAFVRGGTTPSRDATSQQLSITAKDAPVLVLLPPGKYVAGSSLDAQHPAYDPDARDSEMPPITVELDWFFLCKHELSRAQWQRLGGTQGSFSLDAESLGDDVDMHPITEVTWHECDELLRNHRLTFPTELQWEYAARAGTRTPYLTGKQPRRLGTQANFRSAAEAGPRSDGHRYTAPINTLLQNRFGLWHVSGNAAEWCRESYMNFAYSQAEWRPGDAELRVAPAISKSVRGASFTAAAYLGRLASRAHRAAQLRFFAVGLRPARAVDVAK